MKVLGGWIRVAVIGAGMCAVMGGAAETQIMARQQQPGTIPGAVQPLDPLHQKTRDDPQMPVEITEKQAKARNDDRQRRLVADTDKLLALATSLHEDVAKTDKNVLSLDVVRRADEIEKLAHSVKERMKG